MCDYSTYNDAVTSISTDPYQSNLKELSQQHAVMVRRGNGLCV